MNLIYSDFFKVDITNRTKYIFGYIKQSMHLKKKIPVS